jgi:hypothetical protein
MSRSINVYAEMQLKRWFKSILSPFTRLFKMSKTDWFHTEFPELPTGVDSWEKTLALVYASEQAHEHMNDMRVILVEHYKELRNFQHEFLVATVKDTRVDDKHLLQLARHPGRGKAREDDDASDDDTDIAQDNKSDSSHPR